MTPNWCLMEIIVREEEDGRHRLYTQSPAGISPAGERLRKGGEYPIESYVYDTHEAATEVAAALQNSCSWDQGPAQQRTGRAEGVIGAADGLFGGPNP